MRGAIMAEHDKGITIRIPIELKEDYKRYLEWECLTISEDIRNHIRDCVKQYKKEMQIFERLDKRKRE